MTRKTSVLAMVCALVLSGSPALPQQAGDAELAKGVSQAQEGDFENAVVTLDGVASRLAAAGGHGKELARAHLYLSVSYLGLSQPQKAKTQFLEAWKLDPGMELSAKEFPPKVLSFLRQAEQEARSAPPSPVPPAVASGAPRTQPARGLDLGDLEQKARTLWAEYQSQMAADFVKAEQFERQTADAGLKASAWERFLSSYGTDNPMSTADEGLRSRAQERLQAVKLDAERTRPAAQPIPSATPQSVLPPPPPGDPTWKNSRDGLEYVRIPAGTFEMGCVPVDRKKCGADEEPQHTVRISRGFWLGKTEVTLEAYQRMGTGGKGKAANHPVTNVSWEEAKTFCEWSGGRLPTEAEWEHAARGGRGGLRFPWGSTIRITDARYGRFGSAGTEAVGSFTANGFGLHDMAGNVWEWTADWYDARYYASPPASDPTGPATGQYRVLRGGSWDDTAGDLRTSFRSRLEPSLRADHAGFRCARDAGGVLASADAIEYQRRMAADFAKVEQFERETADARRAEGVNVGALSPELRR